MLEWDTEDFYAGSTLDPTSIETPDTGGADTGSAGDARIDQSATAVALTIDQYETGRYGDGFKGAIVVNGEASFVFESPGADITLCAGGYDIDTRTEVEVFVNDTSIGHMTRGRNNTLTNSSFEISSALLQDGTNTLDFRQTFNPDARWGVTEILLLGPGPHGTVLDIEPEFSEDGYVAWQTDDKFYLGRMDLDTGVFLGVLNEVNIAPVGLLVSQQGPELIRTAENEIGAIGVSAEGLVYYTRSEEYVLAGTQGCLIGFLPKGEVPGLRFNMIDRQDQPLLYDNGVITALELDAGLFTPWVNEKEFVITFVAADQKLIGTYNVETGVMTQITDQTYGQDGYPKAFTTSDGEQFVAVSGGNYHDIWHNAGNGWEFFRQISSPFSDGSYLYSVEFFEWQGHTFLGGVIAAAGFDFDDPGAAALCDIDAGSWAQISALGSYVDPEFLVLNGDKIAYYYTDWGDRKEYFFTATYAEVLNASVPDPNLAGSAVAATGVEATAATANGLATGVEATAATANGLPAMPGAARMHVIGEDPAQTIPQQIADVGSSDTFLFRRLTPGDDDTWTVPPARHGFRTAFDEMFMTAEAPIWSVLLRSEGYAWQQKLELRPLATGVEASAATANGLPAMPGEDPAQTIPQQAGDMGAPPAAEIGIDASCNVDNRGSPTPLWNSWAASWSFPSFVDGNGLDTSSAARALL